jgi:hypothetical protein
MKKNELVELAKLWNDEVMKWWSYEVMKLRMMKGWIL